MMTLSTRPVLLKKFNFGKYKDKEFEEVAKWDRDYIIWLYNSEMSKIESDRNENLIFTLSNYLKNKITPRIN